MHPLAIIAFVTVPALGMIPEIFHHRTVLSDLGLYSSTKLHLTVTAVGTAVPYRMCVFFFAYQNRRVRGGGRVVLLPGPPVDRPSLPAQAVVPPGERPQDDQVQLMCSIC